MCLAAEQSGQVIRRLLQVRGQVQGVGFRPFVYRLAQKHQVGGFIRNDSGGVSIEVQGAAAQVEGFEQSLRTEHPALAVIEEVCGRDIKPSADAGAFSIEASVAQAAPRARVTVDTAVCPACVREMLDPRDRRFGYGLINCTDCGPRYSIIQRVPYDRPHTTMAGFVMCEKCHKEYHDPSDRRFHAQPVACRECGPVVEVMSIRKDKGTRGQGDKERADPIGRSVQLLCEGKILAVKGLGGFHLACRANDQEAVLRLRRLKHRDAKPFAVMCADLDQVRQLVDLGDLAAQAMLSPVCPIVLAPRRDRSKTTCPGDSDPLACGELGRTVPLPAVSLVEPTPCPLVLPYESDHLAPANHRLGVMLPYTPIQHLLFARGGDRLGPLVMTSGNVSDEPLAIDNQEALQRLGGMCDAILWHDRGIERCVDDSVIIDMGQASPLPLRRARGYVPAVLPLPVPAAGCGLCVGGELKNTVAVVRHSDAILSQHLGNLTHPLAFASFKRHINDLCDLFDVRPQWVAHDLHPLYLSTVYARQVAQQLRAPLIGIQHHHAHAAAVLAEHQEKGPVLAVVCDGVGYGPDGSSWGGELLLADLVNFRRLGHLRELLLPGGDAAAVDTRRCGLALLYQALGDSFAQHPAAAVLVPDAQQRGVLTHMIRAQVNCAVSTAAGRVFDGVAALLGLCQHNEFEAQAAMCVESAARGIGTGGTDQTLFQLGVDTVMRIDLSPLVRAIIDGMAAERPREELAALFHEQLAAAWEAVVALAVQRTQVRCVALSGGVFCNQRLTEALGQRLEHRGLRVLRHRLVPPNDGGLALGQAAIAAARSAMQEPPIS